MEEEWKCGENVEWWAMCRGVKEMCRIGVVEEWECGGVEDLWR